VTLEKTLVFITDIADGIPPAADCDATLGYDELTLEALQRLGATAVACQLLGLRLDAMMVLRRLAAIGYHGSCIIVSPKLPRRALVLKELQAEVSGIQIDLIETEPDPRLS
jgi:hypothetical protein